MSTDKELLELAALAADMHITPHPNNKVFKLLMFTSGGRNWNPLLEDGDAFRLMIKLNLHIYLVRGATFCSESEPETEEFDEVQVQHEGDQYAATRRAIVLCAASIGKIMEQIEQDKEPDEQQE